MNDWAEWMQNLSARMSLCTNGGTPMDALGWLQSHGAATESERLYGRAAEVPVESGHERSEVDRPPQRHPAVHEQPLRRPAVAARVTRANVI